MKGLDIGTTAAKSLTVTDDGSVVGREERAYGPGATIEEIVAAALELTGDGPVALSSAMHSLVGLDERDRPVTELFTWADTRAVGQAERIKREHSHLHERTGTPIRPMSPLCKLAWLREQGVTAHRWAGIKEVVVHRMTGEWVMDHSIASGTGLMALETLNWDEEALAVAGVKSEQLPRLVPTTERLGELTVGAGDGPLANLGVGAVAPGVAAISIGTSGALRLVVEQPRVTERTFCYALTPGRWVVGGAIGHAGSLAAALAAEQGRPVAELLKRPDARVRAVLVDVCGRLREVLDTLRAAGHEVRELRATGGFARSPLWKQMLADAMAMPVGFTSTREGSAYGAALLGLGLDDPGIEVTEVVEPHD